MTSRDSTSPSPTRGSLIAGLRRGDAQAWSEMVDLYAPLVHQWCRGCGVPADAAADVMQEAFAAAAQHIARFGYRQQGDSFRGWLWTITRNKIRDYHRTCRRQIQSPGGSTALRRLARQPDEASLPEDEPTGDAEISDLVRRGLDQVRSEFEPRTWDAFWRCCVDALPTDLVAKQLEMTPAAVRQARSRVLRRLRRQLGDVT
jgi:RNA polymerase sigma-70 factor, ECF subfamily